MVDNSACPARHAAAAIAAAVVLVLVPASVAAAARPTIEGRPRLLDAVQTKVNGHLNVLAFVEYDNPFVDAGGHTAPRGDVTNTAKLELELFSRRGREKPRLLKTVTTSKVVADRPDQGRLRTTHAFALDARTSAAINRARSAHRKILYRLTIRHQLKHKSRRNPRSGELSVVHARAAELSTQPSAGTGLANYYGTPDGSLTLYLRGQTVTQVQIQGGSLETACQPPPSNLLPLYNAVNTAGAPISSPRGGSFQLADSLGDLGRWNDGGSSSGWMADVQSNGSGVPGVSGTFSADGSTVTITFAQTLQRFRSGTVCHTPGNGSPITLSPLIAPHA